MGIDPLGWCFMILTGLLLPYFSLKSVRRLAAAEAGQATQPIPTGARLLVRVLCFQLILLAFALYVAHSNWIGLFPPPAFAAPELLVGGAFLAVGIGTMRWRFAGMSPMRRRRLAMLMPHDRREWLLFGPTAIAAGIGEEIAFRGLLVVLLDRLLGNWWLAASISAVAFSVAHSTQGRRAVLVILGHSVLFHLLVRMAGSLYLVMALHAIYDLAAGVVFGGLTRGLRPLPVPPAVAAPPA